MFDQISGYEVVRMPGTKEDDIWPKKQGQFSSQLSTFKILTHVCQQQLKYLLLGCLQKTFTFGIPLNKN